MTSNQAIESILKEGEQVIWQGQPDPRFVSPAMAVVRAFGFIGLLCTFFFVAMTIANIDEMEGAWGFMITFIIMSLVVSLAFLFVFPAMGRKSLRETYYAVTNVGPIMTAKGHVSRPPFQSNEKIQIMKGRKNLYSVRFHQRRVRVRDQNQNLRTRRQSIQFMGLELQDAEAARRALMDLNEKIS